MYDIANFRIRRNTNVTDFTTLARGATGIGYNAATGIIGWKAIPHADFIAYAFEGEDNPSTNTSLAVGVARVSAVPIQIGGLQAPTGSAIVGVFPGSNNTDQMNQTLNLSELRNPATGLPLTSGQYTIRLQAVPSQNMAIEGQPGQYWGAPSLVSPQSVTVNLVGVPYEIAYGPFANGNVTGPAVAEAGSTVTLTVTPASGYRPRAGTLQVNGTAITGTTFVMPAADVTVTAQFELIPTDQGQDWPPPPSGGAPPPTVIVDEQVPLAEVDDLPILTVEAEPVDEETAEAAEEAVEIYADAYEAETGKTVTLVDEPVSVSVEDANQIIRLALPEAYNTAAITTMAVLNEDGSLTAIPTRIDSAGNVLVLVSGDVVLVPLQVEASFTDIDMGPMFAHVTAEINRAAAMMIVQGRGNGEFDPTAEVTGQEAATMFLRAIGIPVDFATAIATATENDMAGSITAPNASMSRIATAEMIVAALRAINMNPRITAEEVDEALAQFTDLDGLTENQRIAMAICVNLGIFRGTASGLMNPDDTLRRSHMASLAVRLQDVIFNL